MNEAIMWVIGVLVVCIIAVTVVIPGISTAVTGARTTSTITNEEFTSAGGVAYTALHHPIAAVSNMYINTGNTTTNATIMAGANGTEMFTLVTPLDTDGDENYNITVIYNKTATTNVSVYANGVFLGNLSTVGNAQTDTWNKNTTGLVSPTNITFRNGQVLLAANISSVAIQYIWLNTTTNYTNTATTITPAPAGTYKATYTYYPINDVSQYSILNIIPFMVAVVLLMLVIGSSGMFQ